MGMKNSMAQSTIEWTESTWNPVTGCDDASPGCENCYARRMAYRLQAMATTSDWVIVGGESGPHARPMDPGWVREIRDQCVNAGVAVFFKQWGGVFKKRAGRKLDDRTWDEYPALSA
jgi:protein gp37